mgnify:CR=1 FL=1
MDKSYTELFNALRAGDFAAVKLAFDKGDPSLLIDEEGRTPLMMLLEGTADYPEILEYILYKTNDINTPDHNGNTPLFYAVKNKKREVIDGDDKLILPLQDPLYESVNLLLKAGIDAGRRNRKGETALWCARVEGHFRCAALIATFLGIDISEDISEAVVLQDARVMMKGIRPFSGDLYEKKRKVASLCVGEYNISDYEAASILFWGELLSILNNESEWNFICERFYSDYMGGRAVSWRIKTADISLEHKISMGLNESWQSIKVDAFTFDVKGLPPLLKMDWDGEDSSAYSSMEACFSGVDQYIAGRIAGTAYKIFSNVEFICSQYRSAPEGFTGYEGDRKSVV